MKTIKDAYEELNGDLNNSFQFNGREFSLSYNIISESYICNEKTRSNDHYQYICTVEEFNNYKPEQENKVDYTSLEFWKDAPEGYGYWLEHKSNPSSRDFCRLDKDGSYYFDDGGTPTNIDNWLVVPRPKSSPVFTQEMADNGVLPSVGMECIFKHGGSDCRGVVTAITKEFIVLTEDSGKERIRKLSESPIKPLTSPITLIDGKAYQFDNRNIQTIEGIYNKNCNIFSVAQGQYFDVVAVTNIQPLTVEAK